MSKLLRQKALYGWWNPKLQPPPNVPVELDWEHPLAQGIMHCYLPSALVGVSIAGPANSSQIRDLAFGLPLQQIDASPSAVLVCPQGIQAQTLAGSRGFGTPFWAPDQSLLTTAGSLFTYGYTNPAFSQSNAPNLIGIQYDVGGGSPYNVLAMSNQGSATDVLFSLNSNGTLYYANASAALVSGKAQAFGFSATLSASSTSARGFLDGSLLLTFGSAAGTFQYGANPYICCPGQANSGCTSIFGPLIGALWNRALSDNEQAWLAAEPFVMLRPATRRRWFPTTSAPLGRPRIIQ